MTREESIRHLQAAQLMLLGKDNQPVSDLYYALELAISALEQPDIEAIRREIERGIHFSGTDGSKEILNYCTGLYFALKVIDKYLKKGNEQ